MTTATALNTTTFEIGARYGMTFIGDSDLHVIYEVVARSACFVTVTDGTETVRCKIGTHLKEEICRPQGSYSMAPILGTNDRYRLFNGKLPEELPLGPLRTGMGI